MPKPLSTQPTKRLIVFFGIVSGLLLLGSLTLAVFGYASYNDSFHHVVDQKWGIVAIITASLLFIAGSISFLMIWRCSKLLWYAGLSVHGIAAACIVYLAVKGMDVVADARLRGGDWAGLAVMSSTVFCVFIPAVIGVIALGSALLVLRLNPNCKR